MKKNSSTDTGPLHDNDESHISELVALVKPQSPLNIINILHDETDLVIAKVLDRLPQPLVLRVLHHLPKKEASPLLTALTLRQAGNGPSRSSIRRTALAA